jgi:hypothetical protein
MDNRIFLEIRPNDPLSHASPQETGSSQGRRLHNGLRDVRMARPSSSHRQPPCRFAPLLSSLLFSRKIRPFWLGQARLVRARACRGQNSDFEKIMCRNVRPDLEAFRRFYASETPIFKKNRRNVFRIGTYLRPKNEYSDRRRCRNIPVNVRKISRKR